MPLSAGTRLGHDDVTSLLGEIEFLGAEDM